MKKILVIFSLISVIISCSNNANNTNSDTKEETPVPAGPTVSEDPEVTKGLDLVAKSDCFTCHKVAEASTGPSYEAVAGKYPDNEQVIDSLAGKIIKGGAGNWGTIPMTPHADLSQDDAKTMVKYILSLK